jgi:ketosteroid isomerase-like protein
MVTSVDLATVEAAFAAWTTAVQTGDNDLQKFRTDDATAFIPTAQLLPPGEVRPPNSYFVPEDVLIRVEGTAAIVTFQYHDEASVNRRTFVYRKTGDEWKMMHLHGDNLPRE